MNFAKLIRAALAALTSLLTQCRSLMDSNDALGSRCSALQAENDNLRAQLLVDNGSISTPDAPADPPEVMELQNWLAGNGFATDVDPITEVDTQAVAPEGEAVSESPVVEAPPVDPNGQKPGNPPIPR